jgi:uncharacterized iron-regulated protein
MKKTLVSILFVSQVLTNFSNAKNIILLGESDHRESIYRTQTKEFISQNLLKYDTLALEAIETDKQYLLDNYSYSRSNENLSNLKTYLNTRWKEYKPDSYVDLIDFALDKKLKILAIDEPKHLQAKETEIFPVIPAISKKRKSREKHMSEILCNQNFISNTIVLIGSTHLNSNYLPLKLTQTCNIVPKTQFLQGKN